jgi:4-diphosphocytidyl-2-C-methyl-D-erythritol kinase
VYIAFHGRSALILKAPAKVNLHLEIRARRSDGYHEILSIMQSVPLFDTVHIRSLKEKEELRVLCDPPVPGEKNIAAAAVDSYRRNCGISSGVEVRIQKRIPAGAGLGGGSSDAAAVLTGLNRMFSAPLDRRRLHGLAFALGSDVPFFLGGPAAIVSGRGEVVESMKPRRDYALLLAYPDISISTREAYRWFDLDGPPAGTVSITPQELKYRFERQPPESWSFFNSFQGAVESRHPGIAEIVSKVKESGASLASLSGSGAAVFGVFSGVGQARSAARAVRKLCRRVWVLVPLQMGQPRIRM